MSVCTCLVEGSIPVRVFTRSLKVQVIVIALVVWIEWALQALKVPIIETS